MGGQLGGNMTIATRAPLKKKGIEPLPRKDGMWTRKGEKRANRLSNYNTLERRSKKNKTKRRLPKKRVSLHKGKGRFRREGGRGD